MDAFERNGEPDETRPENVLQIVSSTGCFQTYLATYMLIERLEGDESHGKAIRTSYL